MAFCVEQIKANGGCLPVEGYLMIPKSLVMKSVTERKWLKAH